MDIATVVGISAGMVLLTFGTIYAGLGAGDVLNIPSVLITFGCFIEFFINSLE